MTATIEVREQGVPLRQAPLWVALVGVTVAFNVVSLATMLLAPSIPPALQEWRLYLGVLEQNTLPSWWSTGLLLLAASAHLVAGVAGRSARAPEAAGWFGTGALLVTMSVDDQMELHEQLGPVGKQVATFDAFPFYWVLPGAVVGVAIIGAFALLATRLAARPRRLLVGGVVLFLGCAVGFEVLQGTFLADQNILAADLTYHVEELGENIGALLILGAATSALAITREGGGLALRYGRRHASYL